MTQTTLPSASTGRILDDLGLAIGARKVEIIDFNQAEGCYVHHTKVPVAVAGYALVSPAFAQGKFPKFSFINLINKRPSMDEDEVCALASICGAEVTPPFWGNPEPFGQFLWHVIDKYELTPFFVRLPEDRRFGMKGDHFLMRPYGLDWSAPYEPEIPGALAQWRSNYRKLSPVRQLLVTSVLQLYRQGEDKVWQVRVPKAWHAAEGISILSEQGALADWAKLYALYPGW